MVMNYERWPQIQMELGKKNIRGFFIMIEVANEKLKRFT